MDDERSVTLDKVFGAFSPSGTGHPAHARGTCRRWFPCPPAYCPRLRARL